MYIVRLLMLSGPCLMMVVAAAGLFVAWRSLARLPHVLAWAAAFLMMAMALLIDALTLGHGFAAQATTGVGRLAAALAAILFAKGFSSRSGWPAFLRRSWPIWGTSIVFLMIASLPGMMAELGLAFSSLIQAMAFLWSAYILFRSGSGPNGSVAERMALVAVLFAGLFHVGMAMAWMAHACGMLAYVAPAWLPLLLIEPAAIGLITMFLIASDLSGDLNRLAHTDPLTGVMNRAGFEDAAARALRRVRRSDRVLSLAIADVDRFKAINDNHGHAVGDAALHCFASVLADALGKRGIVGRIGGEEFALLLPSFDGQAALAQIEPLRALIEATTIEGHAGIRMTASFGIAQRMVGEELDSLLARADRALYRSKQDGRNRCSLAARTAPV